MDNSPLKSFLTIPYEKLEQMNIQAAKLADSKSATEVEKTHRAYLKNEQHIKAVTLCFTDIEGRLHMLDYDKKFLLDSADNLTFDGSSVRGFAPQNESDLRLQVDWSSIRFLPSDVFGAGKVVMFAHVLNRDLSPHMSDFRGRLTAYMQELKKEGIVAHAAAEVEGFVVDGVGAEQAYQENTGFQLISSGGYYHSLPLDKLRVFIDTSAEAQRAMGFRNEKDHPEVAPSQFELNFSFAEAVRTCDHIQLYKLVCRQVARNLGMTATFLPKPIAHINGSGMHMNISLSKNGKNVFYKKTGREGLSETAWNMIDRILNHAPELCIVLNSSVNAYRRLDPNYEAPNQIKVSPIDRGSMIRIPIGNEKSARIEVRSVAPDANPYMVLYTLLKAGMTGKKQTVDRAKRERLRFLPSNIYDAIAKCRRSSFMESILGADTKAKFLTFKQKAADRSPRDLGSIVKTSEVIYHHEVTNQMIWGRF